MLYTYRGVVDDEGIIRLVDRLKLKQGTHVLVTLADTDTLVALLKSASEPRLPEERLREELHEDAAWAHLMKDTPSL